MAYSLMKAWCCCNSTPHSQCGLTKPCKQSVSSSQIKPHNICAGREGRTSKGQGESGWGDEQPDRGWGDEQPDRSKNTGWGDEQPGQGRGDDDASYGGAGRGATTEQASLILALSQLLNSACLCRQQLAAVAGGMLSSACLWLSVRLNHVGHKAVIGAESACLSVGLHASLPVIGDGAC